MQVKTMEELPRERGKSEHFKTKLSRMRRFGKTFGSKQRAFRLHEPHSAGLSRIRSRCIYVASLDVENCGARGRGSAAKSGDATA